MEASIVHTGVCVYGLVELTDRRSYKWHRTTGFRKYIEMGLGNILRGGFREYIKMGFRKYIKRGLGNI